MAEAPKPKRRRARKPDGKFQGDNPNTTANEAWEPTDVAPTKKKVDHSVKPKVSGVSKNTAGKYSKKDKVRPTFGTVYTQFN